jgi:hypothetical protein
MAFGTPAQAQATRTWVSGVGDDANPCSRTAPCKTFAGAISKTAVAGEINVLDPGGFGAITITKSITIANDGVGTAGVLVSGTNGIVVSAGASDVVTLRGLDINGLTTGLSGVLFLSGAQLNIDHCEIYEFQASTATGINITPSAGSSKVVVTNTNIHENGNPSTGGGISVKPGAGATAVSVTLDNVVMSNNFTGVRADATNANVAVFVFNSVATGSTTAGAGTFSTGAHNSVVTIRHSVFSNNAFGITANGTATTAILRIGDSIVSGNSTAAAIAGTATMSSYGNNQIFDNGSVGNTPTIISQN